MRPSSKVYMGRTDTIDPTSLVDGDQVEVCMCDTSATCVWSYPATARQTYEGLVLVADREPDRVLPLDRIDGCYTYLTTAWSTRTP